MIQLYSPSNTNFTKNGNITLTPLECLISAEVNGVWELTLTHPIDKEERWKYIEVGAVLRAPSFNGSQLFRIRETQKTEGGILASADPIFMDARGDCYIDSTRPTDKTGQEALTLLCANNNKYSGRSNITDVKTAYFEGKNLIEAIAGDTYPSFLAVWGGEILFNNFEIIINDRIGADYGVQVLYGRNIVGINETLNVDDVVTRIYPKAFNGRGRSTTPKYVDSPLINTYPTIHTRVVEYPHIKMAIDVTGEEPNEGDIICETQSELNAALLQAARDDFTAGIDKPAVTLAIDIVLLQNTKQYEDYKDLENIGLGDTVHCRHSRLDITSDARVMSLTYNALTKGVESVVLNSVPGSFFDRVATTIQSVRRAITPEGAVIGSQIEGFINGALAQLRLQNTIAKKQDVRAILFEDLDPNSPTFGALSIGTQGLQISRERTSDDRDWVWTTAATSEGIVSGTLIAQDQLAVAKHFFADSSGVHVTEDEYDATTGNNVLIDGNSVDIRQGETTVASFGEIILLGQFPRTTSSNDAYFIIGNGYDEYFLDDIFQLRKNGKLIWGGDANPLDYEMYVTNTQGSEQKVFHEGNLDINQTVGNALTPAHGGTGISTYGLFGGGVNASDSVTQLIPSGGSGFFQIGASGFANIIAGVTYLVIAYFEFAANATGRRNVALGYRNDQTGEMVIPYRWLRQFEPARDNGPTTVRLVATLTPQSSDLDWDLCAYQDSGVFLNCSVYYQVIALY